MNRSRPGFAFSIICDLGFAVGIVTHYVEKVGDLVWLAKPLFDEQPGIDQVKSISEWRWPVLFPVDAAVRRKLVTPIGEIDLPESLRAVPTLRSGDKRSGWMAFTEVDGVRQRLGIATDPSTAIYQVVNDTRLKEMLVAGWTPEQEWA